MPAPRPLPCLVLLLATLAAAAARAAEEPADPATVGRADAETTVLPVNQLVTPVGQSVELPGLRPQVLALSPDGRMLVTSGKTNEIVVIDPETGAIKSRVKQVRIPLSELAHVRLHQSAFARWFRLGGNLIVQANGLDFFKDTPGASQGRLSLHVANRDMPEAQQLVSDLMQVGRLTSAPPRIAK